MTVIAQRFRSAGRTAGPPLFFALLVLGLFELLGQSRSLPIFVPAPSVVGREVLARPGLLLSNAAATAFTAASGFAIAVMVAGAAALISAAFGRAAGAVYKTSVVVQSIPIIATAPLLAVAFGTGPPLQIGIAALSSHFAILVGTLQGLKAADANQRELMRLLSATPLQSLRYILVPNALPYIFAGLKIAAPSAVLGAITAEWTGADRGLGTMMLYALFSYDVPKVWLAVAGTSALAALGYGIWAVAEGLTLTWDRVSDLPE